MDISDSSESEEIEEADPAHWAQVVAVSEKNESAAAADEPPLAEIVQPPPAAAAKPAKAVKICGRDGCILREKHPGLCVIPMEEEKRIRRQPSHTEPKLGAGGGASSFQPPPEERKPRPKPKPPPKKLSGAKSSMCPEDAVLFGMDASTGYKGDDVYEVEKLVDRRIRWRRKEYKVRWNGWPPEWDTWEPEKNINDPELMAAYDRKHPYETAAASSSRLNRGP